jgi:mannosyltransferase
MGSRVQKLLSAATATPILPMIVAAALGLITIGDKSVWLDEAFSIAAARLPTLDLLSFLWRFELHASPYYLVLHPWLALGTGEVATRSLAVVFGVLAVLATYLVGKRYGVGFRAALLVSVYPFFIRYEQEVRVYTLAAAWSAVATLAYLRLNEQPTRLRAAVYVAAGAVAIYIHPLVALVIGAHAVAAVVLRPAGGDAGGIPRFRMLALYVPIVIAWLPMFRFMLLHGDRIHWIPPLTPALLVEYMIILGGGLVLAAAVAVLIALGMRRDLLAVWLAVPIVAAIAISILVQPMIQSRYLLLLVPPAAIVIARNRPIFLAGFVALCLVGVGNWYLYGAKDDWRGAVAWVSSAQQPGDGVIFSPHFERLAFEYYGEVGEPLYPSVEWSDRYMPAMGLDIDIPPDVDNPRIWVVEEHGNHLPEPVASVVSHYVTVESRTFGPNGPLIRLMQRQP